MLQFLELKGFQDKIYLGSGSFFPVLQLPSSRYKENNQWLKRKKKLLLFA